MSKVDDGGKAFPQLEVVDGEHDGHGDLIEAYTVATGGMSLRDWFAGQALAEAIQDYHRMETSGPNFGKPIHPYACQAISREEIIAGFAYRLADAMLAERKKAGAP